jgi:hypothetical protein
MAVRPQGRDWAPLIVLAVAGSVALAGGGFLGGYGVGYAQHRPVAHTATPTPEPTKTPFVRESPSPSPTPTPSPTSSPTLTTVQCSLADFPYYPGSQAVAASSQCAEAWHVSSPAGKVADYFGNGAGQLAWQFRLTSAFSSQWIFRVSHAPSCRGSLTIQADPTGGARYQVTPDSQ